MSERKLKSFGRLMIYTIIMAVIFGIISALTGCAYFEIESAHVIDYRFTEAHTEITTRETMEGIPVYDHHFIPAKHELLWEYTYQDGHTEKQWRECTRFEYQNAQKELE